MTKAEELTNAIRTLFTNDSLEARHHLTVLLCGITGEAPPPPPSYDDNEEEEEEED